MNDLVDGDSLITYEVYIKVASAKPDQSEWQLQETNIYKGAALAMADHYEQRGFAVNVHEVYSNDDGEVLQDNCVYPAI